MEEDSREMEEQSRRAHEPIMIPPAEVDLRRTANHPRTPSLSSRPATSSMTFLIAPFNLLASTETCNSTHTPLIISFPLSSLLFSSLLSPPLSAIPHLFSFGMVKLMIAKNKSVGIGGYVCGLSS